MKVCYFTHNSNLTGANRSLLDMLLGMKRQDIKIHVILRKKGPIEQELKKLGIKYSIIKYYDDLESKNPIKNIVKKITNIFALQCVCVFLKIKGIQIVHNNDLMSYIGMKAAKKRKIPYVAHLRDMIEEDHGRRFINKKEVCTLLDNANIIIYISEFVKAKFSYWNNNSNNIVLPDGFQLKNYYIPERKILENKEIKIIIVGTIKETKGQLEALMAYNELLSRGYTNLTFYIVGNPNLSKDAEDYYETIKNYISDNNMKKVHLISFISSTEELKELRRKCDIGLVCSKAEALGRVTVENMLAGCLTIGADHGAIPETIENGINGYIYRYGDYIVLADIIEKAISQKSISRSMAKRGREYALEKYDCFRYSEIIYYHYKKIMNNLT